MHQNSVFYSEFWCIFRILLIQSQHTNYVMHGRSRAAYKKAAVNRCFYSVI